MKSFQNSFIEKKSEAKEKLVLFSAKPKIKEFPSKQEWFFFWSGPLAVIDGKELIADVTIVGGNEEYPLILSPKEFVEKYNFTNIHPFKGTIVQNGLYKKNLSKIKSKIRNFI